MLTDLWQSLDAAVVAATLYGVAHAQGIRFSEKYSILVTITAMLMVCVYSWSDLFYRLRTRTLMQEAGRLLRAWATVLALLMVICYLLDVQKAFPRPLMLTWAVAAYLSQLLVHYGIRKSLHRLRARGYNVRRVLVVGCGTPLERFARFVNQNPSLGLKIEGYVAAPHWLPDNSAGTLQKPIATGDAAASQLRHLGGLGDVGRLVDDLSLSEIYVALPREQSAATETAIRALVNVPVNVSWIPDFSLTQLMGTRTDSLFDQPLLLLSDCRIDRHGQLLKALEDLLLSGALVVLLAPLFITIALCVKLSSPGPVLFKQWRRGLNGRPVLVWKFRTMRVGMNGEVEKQATANDDRITVVGRWLRRSSLDELPQLFNVLQGRMSLVGPRPHPIWLDDKFKIVDSYMQRQRVKPGLTGCAQVHGCRGETDTREKMEQRLAHDLYYMTHWSPWLDLKILALTIPAVLFGKNAY